MGPPKTLIELREWHWRLVQLNLSKVDQYRGHQFAKKAEWHQSAVDALDTAIKRLQAFGVHQGKIIY